MRIMKCKLCNCDQTEIIYNGQIRNGGLGKYTDGDVSIYQCKACGVIWHEPILNNEEYYESEEYRLSLEGSSEEADFYRLHDKESYDKLIYTGTTVFRNGIVADIGCGCGAFLDYVNGVASEVIAVEPSEKYRTIMDKKGFHTYAYCSDAIKDYKEKTDVVTSFDVIEHVEDPQLFLNELFDLLKTGGKGIIGTPTDAPVMRDLLGEIYEKKLLFSTQHLWIFNEESLIMMAQKAGFSDIKIKYYQRYGISNVFGWLREKKPASDIVADYISDTMDKAWRTELERQGKSDYIVLYVQK